MVECIAESVVSEDMFTAEQVRTWRQQVAVQRDILFHRSWKNRRQVVPLKSREQEQNFQFVVEWYEEFGDVVGRVKERQRMDRLIALGYDVNAPREEQPDV